MSKSKLLISAIGLILLIPMQLSSSPIVGSYIQEQDNITHTKQVIVDEQTDIQDFVSGHQENIIEKVELKEYLGEFTITHYCGCKQCNGKWYGMPAANGEPLQEGYTVAVDPDVIPLNSWIEINGKKYKASDTGSAIKGNKIDIYVKNHKKAYDLGKIKNVEVYIVEE